MTVSTLPEAHAAVREGNLHRLIGEARSRARARRLGLAAVLLAAAVGVGGFFAFHGGGPGAMRPSAGDQGGRQVEDAGIRDRFVRFADLPRGHPRGLLPSDVRAASRVIGHLGGATIFAAPTRDGYWEMFAPRSKRGGWNGGVPWRTAKPPYRGSGSFLIGGGGSSNRKGYPSLISGSTLVSPGAKLLLVYADGSRQRIKVIWVSKPIGAGFYYHPIPRTHQTRTRRVIALELIRGSHLVARQVLPVLKFAVGRGGSAS